MAELRRRLARLEGKAGELLPDQRRCPMCHGGKLLAFSDEPDTTAKRFYLRDDGTCCECRRPPPGTCIIQLDAPIAEYFATLPWADDPQRRFLQKATLFEAIAQQDIQKVERIVEGLQESDARTRLAMGPAKMTAGNGGVGWDGVHQSCREGKS
jgi:hypothetical protein